MMEKFPFADDLRTACFTCCHVLEEINLYFMFLMMKMAIDNFYVEKNIIKKKQESFL